MNKHGIKTKFPFGVLIGLIILFAVLFLFNFNFPQTLTDNSNEYQITSMQISAFVREDNSLLIHESIEVNFDSASHGIYRTLPKYQEIAFSDNGTERHERYEISISDVNCSDYYLLDEQSNGYVIRIGDPDSYASEVERYELEYVIHLGDDKITSFDQLYYNFVGDAWDTTISDVSITVTFEKPVEDRTVYFYIGTDGEDIVRTVEMTNSTFSFTYNESPLPAYRGITARTLLDEGYFITQKQSHVVDFVLLGVTLLAVVVAFVIYFTQKPKKHIIPVVEFSAPDGITPPDAGHIIDRSIDRGEVSALIVYWASKGYIKIKQTDGKNLLEKLKDADENMKGYELSIFQAMFPGEAKEFDLDSENLNVAKAINSAKGPIKAENEKFFSKKITSIKNLFLIAFAVLFACVTYFTCRQVLFVEIGIIDSVLIGVGIYLAAYMMMYARTRKLTMHKFSYWLCMIFGSVCILGAYVAFAYFTFNPYSNLLYNTITLPLLLMSFVILALLLDDRVEGKNKEVGRLLGLRQFILLAEKDRIEKLAKENPTMFYDVLPYAYVLGISGEWIDKFKEIEIPTPTWYVGPADILQVYIGMRMLGAINAFNISLTRTLGTTLGKIVSVGKTIGGIGGFGGGGGRSGGGLGGGGGGRW